MNEFVEEMRSRPRVRKGLDVPADYVLECLTEIAYLQVQLQSAQTLNRAIAQEMTRLREELDNGEEPT